MQAIPLDALGRPSKARARLDVFHSVSLKSLFHRVGNEALSRQGRAIPMAGSGKRTMCGFALCANGQCRKRARRAGAGIEMGERKAVGAPAVVPLLLGCMFAACAIYRGKIIIGQDNPTC